MRNPQKRFRFEAGSDFGWFRCGIRTGNIAKLWGGVEATLHDLLDHLPRFSEGEATPSPDKVGAATPA